MAMENNGKRGPEPETPGSQPQSVVPGPVPPVEPGQGRRRRYRYRSLFWPLVLIGAGIIWLLYSLGVLSASNLAVVGLIWPVFVIGIGVDLLLGHRSPAAGAAVAVVTLAIVIVLIAIGPGLGWVGSTALKTETFSTPVGEATDAQIELGLSGYTTTIHALSPAAGADRQLLSATITHRGTIAFSAEGTTKKTVELRSANEWQWWQRIGNDTENPWDIGLAPGLPLSIIVLASSGSNSVDLTGLQLQKLEVDASSGDSQVVLPAADQLSATRPDIELQSSSGRMEVQAPDGSAFTMNVGMSSGDTRVTIGADSTADIRFRGSSGQFLLTVAGGQALRVEVRQVSSGSVNVPDGLTRVSGTDQEGVWQTAGYESAANRVDLVIESMSSGTVKVQVGA
jgi:Putative adhesin